LLFTNNQHIFNKRDSESKKPIQTKKYASSDDDDEPPSFP